jgi:hypothetical protein
MSDNGQHGSSKAPITEYNLTMILSRPFATNAPWLENMALAMEEALIKECAGVVLGPSVTANFEENGWELDLTAEASNDAEADEKFRKALEVVQRVAEISLDREDKQVRSTYHSEGEDQDHDTAVLVC